MNRSKKMFGEEVLFTNINTIIELFNEQKVDRITSLLFKSYIENWILAIRILAMRKFG